MHWNYSGSLRNGITFLILKLVLNLSPDKALAKIKVILATTERTVLIPIPNKWEGAPAVPQASAEFPEEDLLQHLLDDKAA